MSASLDCGRPSIAIASTYGSITALESPSTSCRVFGTPLDLPTFTPRPISDPSIRDERCSSVQSERMIEYSISECRIVLFESIEVKGPIKLSSIRQFSPIQTGPRTVLLTIRLPLPIETVQANLLVCGNQHLNRQLVIALPIRLIPDDPPHNEFWRPVVALPLPIQTQGCRRNNQAARRT